MSEIILVCLQNFQSYIIYNIKNLLDFSNDNITIITDKHLVDNFDEFKKCVKIITTEQLDNSNFDNNCKLNKESQDGLWFQASNRFFYLYDYIKKYNIEKCFHIENDVMVYADLNKYIPSDKKVYLTMDSNSRCIPGLVFISSHVELEPLITNYKHTTNDMQNLGLYYNNNKNVCDTFPIIKKNSQFDTSEFLFKNFENFKVIFDSAAIGQYLGGCHFGMKIPGFINETCFVKYDKYKFFWVKKDENYVPHIEIDKELIPVINLHIHRKELNKFMGKNPLETRLIQFI